MMHAASTAAVRVEPHVHMDTYTKTMQYMTPL